MFSIALYVFAGISVLLGLNLLLLGLVAALKPVVSPTSKWAKASELARTQLKGFWAWLTGLYGVVRAFVSKP